MDATSVVPPPNGCNATLLFLPLACYYLLTVVQVALHVCTLPLVAMNLYVISVTSVLHVNLKLLLQCQSTSLLAYTVGRLIENIGALLDPNDDPCNPLDESIKPTMFITVFGTVIHGVTGNVMVMERCYATVCVKSYEFRRGLCFRAGSMTVMVS